MNMRFTIRDETVHAAFDMLESHAQPAAAARAMRERRDDERRAAKAKAFLKTTGTVAEREALSLMPSGRRGPIMSERYLHLDAEFVKAEIGRLLAQYPELSEDEELRLDTIEGETDARRIVERALAERQEAEMLAGSLQARMVSLSARQGRFVRKAEAMKSLIKGVMKAARIDKLQLPEATLSITAPRETVGIENVDDLPQGFFSIERKPDKAAIKKAFAEGEEVPGAIRVVGESGLMIRTK